MVTSRVPMKGSVAPQKGLCLQYTEQKAQGKWDKKVHKVLSPKQSINHQAGQVWKGGEKSPLPSPFKKTRSTQRYNYQSRVNHSSCPKSNKEHATEGIWQTDTALHNDSSLLVAGIVLWVYRKRKKVSLCGLVLVSYVIFVSNLQPKSFTSRLLIYYLNVGYPQGYTFLLETNGNGTFCITLVKSKVSKKVWTDFSNENFKKQLMLWTQ